MNFIGESVRKLRLNKGITQDELAKKVNMSSSRISSIELGNADPTAKQVVYLATALEEPALMLAKCRGCDIRNKGFEEFFPEIDLSTYVELIEIINQLKTNFDDIESQLRIVGGMHFGTDEFATQFTKLREMLRTFSYASATAANVSDLTVFLKRGFVKFGEETEVLESEE